MKSLFRAFAKIKEPKFAIKREIRINGAEKLTPVVMTLIGGLVGDWTPIVKVEDKYQALHIEGETEFSEERCLEYIAGYRKQLEDERGGHIEKVIYQEVAV